jgi:putative peptidoglycan lipid II flippase
MNFARSIITVGGMTILSRVAGFVRDTLSANILGAGPAADAFFVALRLPSLFRALFAEGAFSAAFVPLYAKVRKEGGEAMARLFTGEAMAVQLAVLLPLTILFIVFMPQAMVVLAPGFDAKPETFGLSVEYSRITFPYLMLISVVALLSAVLNSHKHFAAGAAAPILFNLLLIAGLLLAPVLNQDPGWMMSMAVLISGFVQWIWLDIHCRVHGLSPKITLPKLSPRVKQLFKNAAPAALGAGAAQINLAMSTILASLLPTGAVSYLFYADRLNQLPLGIVGIAISTTLLPVLSARVQADDQKGIRRYVGEALDFGLMLGLPAAVGLGLAAHPIIHVLFEHGAFTAKDTDMTAAALTMYVIGIVPFILVKILSSLCFAHYDTKTPVRIAIFAVVLNIVLALLLLQPMGHVGMALATSLATWANVIGLSIALKRKKLVLLDPSVWPRTAKIILSAAAMALFLWGTGAMLEAEFAGSATFKDVGWLALYLMVALVIYVAAIRLTGAMTWKELKKMLSRADDADVQKVKAEDIT